MDAGEYDLTAPRQPCKRLSSARRALLLSSETDLSQFTAPISRPGGFLIGHRSKPAGLNPDRRIQFVEVRASPGRASRCVALGDSVTEETWLDDACGRTFNAAVGGSRVRHVRAVADAVLPRLKPKTIIVAVGANHFWKRPEAEFQKDYPKLLASLPSARLILMGVPNSPAASAFVQSLARQRGATYIPPVTGSGNTIPDGVHLTPQGAALFRQRVQQACR